MSTAPARRRGGTLLLALVLTVAAAAWLGLRAAAVRAELDDARRELVAAREALLDGRPEDARRDIQGAGAATQRARSLTSDPVWRAAAAVPYAGASFDAVRRVALAADDVARVALPPALEAALALEPEAVRRDDGSFDLQLLHAALPPVDASGRSLARVRSALEADPAGPLPSVVAEAMDELREQVDALAEGVESARQALDLAPLLLGEDRPRRYFVLVQQTSESRGTGGLAGGFAVLETDAGRIRVAAQGSNAELRNGPVPVPEGITDEYVQLYAPNGAFEIWPNVNLSPDLPAVARVVGARWREQSGQAVDGVVAMDGLSLQSLLRGSPPLRVGSRQVPVEQLADYLAVEQYRGLPGRRSGQDERKDELGEVAAVVATRLARGEGDTGDLLRGLVDAVRSGHLRLASDDPALAGRLREAGIDGALPDGSGPVAYPVVSNSSAGKLDHFLDRRVEYVAEASCRSDRRRSNVRVVLTNDAPASGLPPYVTLRGPGGQTVQSTTSAVTLSVYATRGSRLVSATLDGEPITTLPRADGPYLSAATEGGLPLWYVQLDLPRATPRELVLRLDEPRLPGLVHLPEQPLARPLERRVDAEACPG